MEPPAGDPGATAVLAVSGADAVVAAPMDQANAGHDPALPAWEPSQAPAVTPAEASSGARTPSTWEVPATSAPQLLPPLGPTTPDTSGALPSTPAVTATSGATPADATRPRVLKQASEEAVAWIKTLASAAVYATLIVTFGFQVARVEGQSMAPTLTDQDRLIVNKLVYQLGEPRRGDIVMLYYPVNPDKSFVKRVIAEEGDEVRIVDGRVFVNDVPLRDDYVPEEFRSHEDWGPQRIDEGYYFVMGDHRNNSSDSRHWGLVPKKYIIGKVQVRWWPLPAARIFD